MEGKILFSALAAFLLTLFCTPPLVRFSIRKSFFANRNHRSSHSADVPNTGGILLSFAVLLPFLIFSGYANDPNFHLLAAAFAVLLITGAIDDFTPMPVFFKFLGQFIPAIVIVSGFNLAELRVPFLPYWDVLPGFLSYLIWIVIIVTLMNAYNLIDGIDGLAIGLGMFASLVFGILFYRAQFHDLTIFAFTLTAGLGGLLYFNLSEKRKIFIGDTGSLLIGGIIGFFALRYANAQDTTLMMNGAAFKISGAVFIPVADMFRVIILRLAENRSPFSADRNHVHHLILDRFGLSHAQVSLVLVSAQAAIFTLFALFEKVLPGGAGHLVILAGTFLTYAVVLRRLKRSMLPV